MMMFSFSPRRSSFAPRIEASVSTRVVSWNEAAEMNDWVVRLAFVMPSSSGSDLAEALLVDVLPLEELRLPRLDDAHLLEHLAHDHADVLVVDLHALEAVDLLHLVQQVLLHRARALDAQDVVRVHRPLGQTVAGAHAVALVHAQVLARRDLVQLRLHGGVDRRGPGLRGVDEDLALAALDLAEPHDAVDLGDRRRI